ncbi:PREDICTED: LOW QUALITY PROTEIN H/ACA ribonucleo complex [Prunus dulcis]|uniref:PREDICTED: LOW QUALITY PROTEIN H/ACA ribonucleo complex n=1 Tax=Prunus dulcis TaxID=3755 RepID=A0A5E4G669_PRUDU|nr:PREDICTED: LOW QUALITY PROTEIN H/ACA ribonucleo complex [Prunus dulcis]
MGDDNECERDLDLLRLLPSLPLVVSSTSQPWYFSIQFSEMASDDDRTPVKAVAKGADIKKKKKKKHRHKDNDFDKDFIKPRLPPWTPLSGLSFSKTMTASMFELDTTPQWRF